MRRAANSTKPVQMAKSMVNPTASCLRWNMQGSPYTVQGINKFAAKMRNYCMTPSSSPFRWMRPSHSPEGPSQADVLDPAAPTFSPLQPQHPQQEQLQPDFRSPAHSPLTLAEAPASAASPFGMGAHSGRSHMHTVTPHSTHHPHSQARSPAAASPLGVGTHSDQSPLQSGPQPTHVRAESSPGWLYSSTFVPLGSAAKNLPGATHPPAVSHPPTPADIPAEWAGHPAEWAGYHAEWADLQHAGDPIQEVLQGPAQSSNLPGSAADHPAGLENNVSKSGLAAASQSGQGGMQHSSPMNVHGSGTTRVLLANPSTRLGMGPRNEVQGQVQAPAPRSQLQQLLAESGFRSGVASGSSGQVRVTPDSALQPRRLLERLDAELPKVVPIGGQFRVGPASPLPLQPLGQNKTAAAQKVHASYRSGLIESRLKNVLEFLPAVQRLRCAEWLVGLVLQAPHEHHPAMTRTADSESLEAQSCI